MVAYSPRQLLCATVILLIVFTAGALSADWHIRRRLHVAVVKGVPRALPRTEPLREISPTRLLTAGSYADRRQEVDALVTRAVQLEEFGHIQPLAGACAHALVGGKRLRPILLMEVARAVALRDGTVPVDTGDGALAVEYLHTASLVVDDLPDFDDDASRRGRATVHVLTSPAVAQLAALSLVAAAFQNFCRQVDWVQDNLPQTAYIDEAAVRICSEVSRVLGSSGAAAGQCMDAIRPALAHANGTADGMTEGERSAPAIMEIIRLKTATVFELCLVAGALIAGGNERDVCQLRRAGSLFGTAFQVADDIGDMAQDAARADAGKPAWNYANLHGEPAARELITKNLDECRVLLQESALHTPLWDEIYVKVWAMAEGNGP